MNRRWDSVCQHATRLQGELQTALMQCEEFHHTIHDLLLWLEGLETRLQQCEPVNMATGDDAWTRLRKLQVMIKQLNGLFRHSVTVIFVNKQLLYNKDNSCRVFF